MTRCSVMFLLAACRAPAAPPVREPDPAPPVDAAIAVDRGPPAAVLAAPAWIFRYATKDRTEVWRLQYADGAALLVVTGTQTTRYTGTAAEGASLALELTSPTAKMSLACKHEKRPLSAKCNDTKAAPVDVLACYHPDFASPMTFGAMPGIEYVVDATCNGFRVVQ